MSDFPFMLKHAHVSVFGYPPTHAWKFFSYNPLTVAYAIVIPVCHVITMGNEIPMGHDILMCHSCTIGHENMVSTFPLVKLVMLLGIPETL